MTIDCENCGKQIDSTMEICEHCDRPNQLHPTFASLDNEDECCETCSHYAPAMDIQCPAFAKLHKWDRDMLEIDCPDSFRCGVYHAK